MPLAGRACCQAPGATHQYSAPGNDLNTSRFPSSVTSRTAAGKLPGGALPWPCAISFCQGKNGPSVACSYSASVTGQGSRLTRAGLGCESADKNGLNLTFIYALNVAGPFFSLFFFFFSLFMVLEQRFGGGFGAGMESPVSSLPLAVVWAAGLSPLRSLALGAVFLFGDGYKWFTSEHRRGLAGFGNFMRCLWEMGLPEHGAYCSTLPGARVHHCWWQSWHLA